MNYLRILILFITLSSFSAIGQKRIGVDLSSRLNSLNLTLNYQQVVRPKILLSTGIFFGSVGVTSTRNDSLLLYNGMGVQSPFSNANEAQTDSAYTYHLLDYRSTARIAGIQLGVGFFHEFGVVHGIRANLYTKLAWANSKLLGFYRTIPSIEEKNYRFQNSHFVGAVSLEVNHTIRLSGRFTLYYGMKLPYYFTLDKAKFNPRSHADLLSGFEPEVSLGITRVIGKCD